MESKTGMSLLISLQIFVKSLREDFQKFEEAGKVRSGNDHYKCEAKRKIKRNKRWDSGDTPDTTFPDPRENFKVRVFLVIVDQLSSALEMRISAYATVVERFGFLEKLSEHSQDAIRTSAAILQSFYPDDLEEHGISDEFVQFAAFVRNQPQRVPDQGSTGQAMHAILQEDEITSAFPNVEITLRIYLSLMCTNCSGERSFSKLGRVKNVLRSTMGQARLNHLSLLFIEHDLLKYVDVETVISTFANSKVRHSIL